MATSSITKNFIISGQKQVETFANAIEKSYQESLHRSPDPDMEITYLQDPEEIKEFFKKRRNIHA